MKKYYILPLFLLLSVLLSVAQVGINVLSPTGILHISPQNDAILTDDVIVSTDGNVGVGTLPSQSKLHINASASETALRIVDGNQKSDLVLVSADATGGAKWGAIKGSGGTTFVSTVTQSFTTAGVKLYLTGTNTRYTVPGQGPYLVYLRWWGKAAASNGISNAYVRLLKNGTVVDTIEYYLATSANTAFSMTVALMASCAVGDYLEILITPGGTTWTSAISPVYTRVSTTFFLM